MVLIHRFVFANPTSGFGWGWFVGSELVKTTVLIHHIAIGSVAAGESLSVIFGWSGSGSGGCLTCSGSNFCIFCGRT